MDKGEYARGSCYVENMDAHLTEDLLSAWEIRDHARGHDWRLRTIRVGMPTWAQLGIRRKYRRFRSFCMSEPASFHRLSPPAHREGDRHRPARLRWTTKSGHHCPR